MGELPQSTVLDISQSPFAVHSRQLFDVIDQIRDIPGQQELQLPLPRIVVIGNQSAGKSSLIEAIARNNLPRGARTCTRCPIEVRLRKSNEPWRCSICLKFEYDDMGNKMSPLHASFGDDIRDPSQVEIMIRRAQIAVLNGEYNPNIYLDVDPVALQPPETQRQFSQNLICIEVSSPDLTDLSFIDLPGIIHHHASDPEVIELTQIMVREYINDPAVLILCTVTMKDDLENQAALSEAQRADQEGRRTMGVLTKPDTVHESDVSCWIDVLKNKTPHRLSLGWFVTKQPDTAKTPESESFDSARDAEVHFFKTTEAWHEASASLEKIVGIPRLIDALSHHLSTRIRASLPDLSLKIDSRLVNVMQQLRHLGPGPSLHPVVDMVTLCSQFIRALEDHILGKEGSEGLVQANNEEFKLFKTTILNTAPLFHPYTTEELELNKQYSEPMCVVEECGDWLKRRHYRLEAIREKINAAMTRELPFNVPYVVKVNMILSPIQRDWKDAIDQCFEKLHAGIGERIERIRSTILGKFDHTDLLDRVRGVVKEQLALRVKRTQDALDLLFEMEEQGPFTQNVHYFNQIKTGLLENYR